MNEINDLSLATAIENIHLIGLASFSVIDGRLEAAFEDVPEDEDWAWYPSNTIRHSFYLASDMVIYAGILRVTGETDPWKAFDKIMDEVVSVSNEMTDFFLYLMRAIVTRYLGDTLLSPRMGTGTRIANAPNFYKFAIPFFTVKDDDEAAPQG